MELLFPFSAIVGQEQCKLPFILNMTDPHLGGVLLVGKSGTAKTALMRSAVELAENLERIDVPLGITEEQLWGEPDYIRMISCGEASVSDGVIKRAHGGVVAIDNINLLSEQLLFGITEASETHKYQTSEGLLQKSDFILFGTMNPDEGWISSGILERFGMLAETSDINSLEARTEIIRRQADHERDPAAFRNKFKLIQNKTKDNLKRARGILKEVSVPDSCYDYASRLANENAFEGHRGEVTMIRAARALCAWENRFSVAHEDIERVSQFVIPIHGRSPLPEADTADRQSHEGMDRETGNEAEKEKREENSDKLQPESSEADNANSEDNIDRTDTDVEQTDFQKNILPPNPLEEYAPSPGAANLLDSINDGIEGVKIQLNFPKRIKKDMGTGKRAFVRTQLRRGRYIKFKTFKTASDELAIDATIRRAVLFQRFREKGELAIAIEKSDMRAKIREKKTGASILFVVDASGSMRARHRLQALKTAVLSMLKQAYEKRDRVGIISFRGRQAEVILPITHSHDLAYKRLRDMPMGGSTPLASALEQARFVVQAEKSKNPNALQMVVLISDGRSNVPLYTADALADAMSAAKELSREPAQLLVLDCEESRFRLGLAEQLSEALKAEYVKLDQITANEIMTHINRRRRRENA